MRTVDVEACMDYAARNGLFRVDEADERCTDSALAGMPCT